MLTTYDDLPLQFYTDLRVIGCLQGQPLMDNPDWIILRQRIISTAPGKDLDVVRFIQSRIDLRQYELAGRSYPDYTLATNPDPLFHLFMPSSDRPPIVLLRRIHRD